VQWRNLTVGQEKYIAFPPGVDFAEMLGERGVGRGVVFDNIPDLEAEAEAVRKAAEQQDSVTNAHGDEPEAAPMVGTEASVKEVEAAVADGDNSAPMDVDAQRESADRVAMPVVDKPILDTKTVRTVGDDQCPKSAAKPSSKRTTPQANRRSMPERKEPIAAGAERLASPLVAVELETVAAESAAEVEDKTSPNPGLRRSPRKQLRNSYTGNNTRDQTVANARQRRRSKPVSLATPKTVDAESAMRSTVHTPTRQLSVVMPPVGTAAVIMSSPSKQGTKALVSRSVIPEPYADSSNIRSSPRKRPRVSTVDESYGDDTEMASVSSRTGPRRSAANKATRRLREEIMPDVNKFQNELKRGTVRAVGELEARKERGKGQAHENIDLSAAKGKKRVPAGEDEGSGSEVDRGRKKKRLSTTSAKGKGVSRDGDGRSKKYSSKSKANRREDGTERQQKATPDETDWEEAPRFVYLACF